MAGLPLGRDSVRSRQARFVSIGYIVLGRTGSVLSAGAESQSRHLQRHLLSVALRWTAT